MKKLITTFLKDVKISFNGLYFYIEVGLAVIFVLIMLFVVPENFEDSQAYHIHLDFDEPYRTALLEQISQGTENITLHPDVDSVRLALEENRSAVGVFIKQDKENIIYEMILQGYESERMKSMIKASIEGGFISQLPDFQSSVTTTILDNRAEKLSDRLHVLPVYLTMNVALMGLFIIAAYIFLDKDEGVIKAYAVAPVSIWQYLLSKMLIMLLMGISTSLLVLLTVAGPYVNYFVAILAVTAFNLFGSALGLLISSFFDSMSKAMGALYFAIMFMMFASVSYFMPSFNPVWIRYFPSYPMLFSFREILLSNGNITYVYRSVAVYLVLASVIFAFATIRFKKTITV